MTLFPKCSTAMYYTYVSFSNSPFCYKDNMTDNLLSNEEAFFKFHFIFISNYQILNTMQVLLQHKPPSTFYQHLNHTKYNLICIYKAISCTGYPRHCQYSFIMAAKKVRWLPLARKKIEEKSLRGQVIQRKTLSKAQVSQLISQS